MKRVLILLLLLAVAGGLFAQVTWSGYVNAGLGVLKLDDADDPSLGLLAKDAWVNGLRSQLDVAYANEDETAGFSGRIRASAIPGVDNDEWNGSIHFRRAFGWVTAAGGMFKFVGGRIDATDVDGNDGIWDDTWFDKFGLIAYLKPLDILTVGFGGYSAFGLADGKTWDDSAMTIWAGLGVDLGIADVRAQFTTDKAATNAFVTTAIGLGIVDIGLGGYFNNLTEFGDSGIMYLMGSVGLNVLEGLGLNLGGLYASSSAADDPVIAAGVWGDFALGAIKPSLGVVFSTGTDYDYSAGLGFGNNWWNCTSDYAFNKDLSYLTINPAVYLGLGAGTLEIGALINSDMGKANAAGSSNKGLSFGAYLDYVLSF